MKSSNMTPYDTHLRYFGRLILFNKWIKSYDEISSLVPTVNFTVFSEINHRD